MFRAALCAQETTALLVKFNCYRICELHIVMLKTSFLVFLGHTHVYMQNSLGLLISNISLASKINIVMQQQICVQYQLCIHAESW